MAHKYEIDFKKQQARTARSTLVRLKHRLAANEELYYTEEAFESELDEAIQSGGTKLLDAKKVFEVTDGLS